MAIVDTFRFTNAEYENRLRRVRDAMEKRGLDTLIVSDPSNMAWLTGYDGWSFYVHQAVIIGPHGAPVWFGREQDAEGALRTVYMDEPDIIAYPDFFVQSSKRHPMDYLAAKLTDRGWHHGKIGVEMDNYWFSARGFLALSRGLPDDLIDATNVVNWLRGPKSPAELDRMRNAGKIVERMHARIAELVEPGIRKCDLVAEIYDAALRYDDQWGFGGDYPAIVPLLPSGTDAAAPHLTWDDDEMVVGEGTFFEIAGCFRRYTARSRGRYSSASRPRNSSTQRRRCSRAWRPGSRPPSPATSARTSPSRSSRCCRSTTSSRTTGPDTRSASPTRRIGGSAPAPSARRPHDPAAWDDLPLH